MNWIERSVILAIVVVLVALTAWMQSDLIAEPEDELTFEQRHDPDYYIENFIAVGMDIDGNRKYVLEAARLVHYPDDDTALLDKPHIIQHTPDRAPTHVYAETGWVSPDGDEVIMTGNVRVIRGKDASGSGGVTTTERLRIVLKEPISKHKGL
jgi:lipopolysaccharide export system protein LptC